MTSKTPVKPKAQKPRARKPVAKSQQRAKPLPPAPVPAKRKVGRPPGDGYTPAIGRRICEQIAVRVPLYKICQQPGMPGEATVYAWRQKHSEFSENYTRARETRAESRADRIDEICDLVKSGTLDPNAARVIIDAEKWQASKEQPKKFGEKVEIDTPKDGGFAQAAAVTTAALAALVERRK